MVSYAVGNTMENNKNGRDSPSELNTFFILIILL